MGDVFERGLRSGSEPDEEKCEILYQGFVPGEVFSKLDRIEASSMTPEEFYESHVKPRRPVILSGLTGRYDGEFKTGRWTRDYLKGRAGDCTVMVERLGPDQRQGFGYAVPKVPVSYSEFLDGLEGSNDRCYMTTQDLEEEESDTDEFGMPRRLFSSPLTRLLEDFPTRPTMAGNLVPHLVSLWQGLSLSGSSSGLHHDFDDNVYILLRGKKRFRLFPPSCIESLKTAGKPLRVFNNGLIAYEEEGRPGIVNVRSDGVPLYFLAALRMREAEEKIETFKAELESVKRSRISIKTRKERITGLKKAIQKARAYLEEATQDTMLYGEGIKDDFELDSEGKSPRDEGEEADSNHGVVDDSGGNPSPPNHFCGIQLPLDGDQEELFRAIGAPADARDLRCLVAELEEGDSLYLPASWFHEVTSFSGPSSDHLALNYWFYPPDGSSFSRPYASNFWSKRFASLSTGSSSDT